MKHARDDYDRIQDPAGKIPHDEPVFLIRGQDAIGGEVVMIWARLAEIAGAAPHIVTHARQHADRMMAWPRKKIPDMPPQERADAEIIHDDLYGQVERLCDVYSYQFHSSYNDNQWLVAFTPNQVTRTPVVEQHENRDRATHMAVDRLRQVLISEQRARDEAKAREQ